MTKNSEFKKGEQQDDKAEWSESTRKMRLTIKYDLLSSLKALNRRKA